MAVKHVLDILEEFAFVRSIKDEGREVITNITRFKVVGDDVLARIQRVLGLTQKFAQPGSQSVS